MTKMTTTPQLLALAITFSAGFGVAKWTNIQTSEPTVALSCPSSTAPSEKPQCETEIANAVAQFKSRSMPVSPSTVLPSSTHQETKQPSLVLEDESQDIHMGEGAFKHASAEDVENHFKMKEQMSAHIQKIQEAGSLESFNTQLEQEFEAEEVDYEWAAEQETKLSELVYSSNDLEQYAIDSIECKSSRCKINLPATDTTQANEISERFIQTIASDGELAKNIRVIVSPDGKGGVNFFVNQPES